MYESLYSDGLLHDRITNLLKNIGFSPVCELLVMLVACTPLPRNNPAFTASTKQRWMLLEKLNNWNLFYQIARMMTNPEEHCNCQAYVSADQHSSAAAFLIQELVEKLSLEDTGDLLLPSIGHDSSFIDLLIDSVVDKKLEAHIRRSSARIINFLLRRAAESEIICFIGNVGNGVPTATYVPNRLFALREKIVTYVKNRLTDVIECLVQYDEVAEQDASANTPVKYSSYQVKRPFGALRSFMIEILALTVESEETVAGMIPFELWKKLISWSLKYAHNNVYHALFYRLIFAVLR